MVTGLVSPTRSILGVVGDTVWVGPRGPNSAERRLLGFDVATLAPRGEVAIAEAPYGGVLDGTLFAHEPERGRIEVLDLAARARVADVELGDEVRFHGFAGGRIVLSSETSEAPELRLADPRTLQIVQTARVAKLGPDRPAHVFTSPTAVVAVFGGGVAGIQVGSKLRRPAFEVPCDGYPTVATTRDGQRVVVAAEPTILCVDVAACRVVWRVELPAAAVGDGISAVRVRDDQADVIAHVERRSGPALLITRLALDAGAISPTVERAGRFGDLPNSAFDPEPPATRAEAHGGEVEVVRPGKPIVRISLPGDAVDALLDGDRLFSLGRHLVSIDLGSIGPRATTLELETVATSEDASAIVASVGSSTVAFANHPVHGRTRFVNDSSGLAVGDAIVLEDVSVKPGNVVVAGGWHRPRKRAAAAEIVKAEVQHQPVAPRDADMLHQPVAARDTAVRSPLEPLISPIERLFGTPLPLLRTLVAACDATPELRRLWEQVALPLDLDGYEPPDDDTLIERLERLGFTPFASEDGRLYHGVVFDRRRERRGVAALYPEGDFDLWWDSGSFDEWVAHRLASAGPAKASAVKLLVEALGVDPSFVREPSSAAPAWFE